MAMEDEIKSDQLQRPTPTQEIKYFPELDHTLPAPSRRTKRPLCLAASGISLESSVPRKEADGVVLKMPLGKCASTFNLEKAVCNHGFFMMAPNLWIPSTKTLQRPLRLPSSTSLTVSISHRNPSSNPYLHIFVHDMPHDHQSLSYLQQNFIMSQVSRMLRISEQGEKDVREFHRIHAQAKLTNFGRIFRAPTFFEDVIKSILLCNSTLMRTLKMAEALCKLQSVLHEKSIFEFKQEEEEGLRDRNTKNSRKRKKHARESIGAIQIAQLKEACKGQKMGNFPSPQELATLEENVLRECCGLGHRAGHILGLARKFENDKGWHHNLEQLSLHPTLSNQRKAYARLMLIKGCGPFVSASILMCLGFYGKVPTDTETVRHLQEVHGKKILGEKAKARALNDIYGTYAPFQCLAYWFELCQSYENIFGKLSELPSSSYVAVSGSTVIRWGNK